MPALRAGVARRQTRFEACRGLRRCLITKARGARRTQRVTGCTKLLRDLRLLRVRVMTRRIGSGDVLSRFGRRYAGPLPGAMNVAGRRQAARAIEGEHELAAFESAGTDVATSAREVIASRLATTSTTERTGTNGEHGNPKG